MAHWGAHGAAHDAAHDADWSAVANAHLKFRSDLVADTSADTGAEFVADVHALALANDGPEPRADSSSVVVSDKGALLGSIGRTDTCANVSAVEMADARALASPHICAVGAADGRVDGTAVVGTGDG